MKTLLADSDPGVGNEIDDAAAPERPGTVRNEDAPSDDGAEYGEGTSVTIDL